jgi:hypothetical protein
LPSPNTGRSPNRDIGPESGFPSIVLPCGERDSEHSQDAGQRHDRACQQFWNCTVSKSWKVSTFRQFSNSNIDVRTGQCKLGQGDRLLTLRLMTYDVRIKPASYANMNTFLIPDCEICAEHFLCCAFRV